MPNRQSALAAWSVTPLLRRESRALSGSSFLGVLAIGVELLEPWPLSIVIDRVVEDRSYGGVLRPLGSLSPEAVLLVAGAATIALAALAGLVNAAATVLSENAAERIGSRLRRRVFDRTLGLSLRWHDRHASGEVVSRLTSDVDRVLDAVSVVTRIVPNVVLLSTVVVVLGILDPGLAVVGLAAIPLLAMFAVRQRRRLRAVEVEARIARGALAATVTDLLRNIRAVQALGADRRAGELFDVDNSGLVSRELTAIKTAARWSPLADVVLALGVGAVLVLGGQRVLDGALSTGTLVVVLTYVRFMYSPVRSLTRASASLAKARASDERLNEILDNSERIEEVAHPVDAPAQVNVGVRFENVTFAYGERPVLAGLDLQVRAGELVCVTGPSGAGKSTLLSLLLRLYDADAGVVSIDGIDIRRMRLASLRSRVALVPQDPWLLDASIADNIAFGAADRSRAAIEAAADAALVSDFARDLPDGLDSGVGEAGARLSGGQRRRIAIARALAADAPILLLDEPTASLDRDAADGVIASIRSAAASRTVVLVTHEPDVAKIADRVISLPELSWPTRPPTVDLREGVKRNAYQQALHGGRRHAPRTAPRRTDPHPEPLPLAEPHAHA